MSKAHAPTSPPGAASSHARKLGPATVWDRLDDLSQQHADANADPRPIFGASRNASRRAVAGTAGTPNLSPVRDMTPSLEFRTIHGYRCAFRVAGSGPAI